MIDRRWLETWIQPQHLDPAALDTSRDCFASHPARLVVLQNFLVPQMAQRLAQFLEKEAEFAPEFGLYSHEGAVNEDAWTAAEEPDRFFRLGKLVRTPAHFQMSPNALTYLQFRKAFQRPELRAFFEAISGLPLGWSDDFGSHAMAQGDFLRPHSDSDRHRRLALVIYLSQDWESHFGGALHVIDQRSEVAVIEPHFNSVIAFDVLAAPAHLVTPITQAAGERRRLSIGGWYHTPES